MDIRLARCHAYFFVAQLQTLSLYHEPIYVMPVDTVHHAESLGLPRKKPSGQ